MGETIGTEETQSIPTVFALRTVRPNPFRTGTVVSIDVPASGGDVQVSVFDASGRLVRKLADGARAGGVYPLRWDGANGSGQRVRPGVYFVQLDSPAGRQSQKVVLLK
jgi:flagellar hook assembly protein FlgD